MTNRTSPSEELLSRCEEGLIDPLMVVKDLLTNWLSRDDANEFARQEYGLGDDDDE